MRSRSLRVFIILTLLASFLSASAFSGATPGAAAAPPPPAPEKPKDHQPNSRGRVTSPPPTAAGVASQPGKVFGWGYNSDGEVGNGTYTTNGDDSIPFPTQAFGIGGIKAIDSNEYHTLALSNDGFVYA